MTVDQFISGMPHRYLTFKGHPVVATFKRISKAMPCTGELVIDRDTKQTPMMSIAAYPMPEYQARNFFNYLESEA